jgi:transitional endoplasmic reticulum ATPase
LTEICQKAAKAAVRESIEAEAKQKAFMKSQEEQGKTVIKPEVDPVPELTRHHFDEAFSNARKSVTSTDIQKFREFALKYNPNFSGVIEGQYVGNKDGPN